MTTTTRATNPRPSTCLDVPGAVDLDVEVTLSGEVTHHCAVCGGPVDDDGDRECGHDRAEVVTMLAREPRTITGEVTLAPGHDGELAAYGGQPDHWISGALIAELHRLDDDAFRAACREIEAAAVEAAAHQPPQRRRRTMTRKWILTQRRLRAAASYVQRHVTRDRGGSPIVADWYETPTDVVRTLTTIYGRPRVPGDGEVAYWRIDDSGDRLGIVV